jgi:protein-tyrosine-phosphatase
MEMNYQSWNNHLPSDQNYAFRRSVMTRNDHLTANFLALVIALSLAAACGGPMTRPESPTSQILFVCEHGNVKSLMAVSYFNQLAQERGLPLRAISRGSAPDSDTVPAAIREALKGDGFDVSAFHPVAVSTFDISASHRVVLIGTTLPASVGASGVTPENWDDVPPASVDYPASRESLKAHVKQLIDQLTPQAHK